MNTMLPSLPNTYFIAKWQNELCDLTNTFVSTAKLYSVVVIYDVMQPGVACRHSKIKIERLLTVVIFGDTVSASIALNHVRIACFITFATVRTIYSCMFSIYMYDHSILHVGYVS